MLRTRRLLLPLFFAAAAVHAGGADGWMSLKPGMRVDEAAAALGAPLLRTEGRGFEIWTYDNKAEVVFYGTVIAWSAPPSGATPKHVVEHWQFNQGLSDQVVLPPLNRRPRPAQREAQAQVFLPATDYGFRYRR